MTARKPGRPRKIRDDDLRQLWPMRLPDKEIAARMGHSIGAIRRRARQLGLAPRRVIWSREAAS
jgi:hypothetical protein